MKKLLLAATALLLATASANAGNITFGLQLDAGPISTIGPGGSTANLGPVGFGSFDISSLSAITQGTTVFPDLLNTQTLVIDALAGTNIPLHIYVTAQNIVGLAALQGIQSSFDNVGLAAGWNDTNTTFVDPANGLFGGIPMFNQTFLGPSTGSDHIGAFGIGAGPVSFTAEYTINPNLFGGESNLGIDIKASAVPGPIVGAGIPGLLGLLGYGGFWWRRRKKVA